MRKKSYLAVATLLIAVLLFTLPIANAQYSDSVSDSTGDVDYWYFDDNDETYGWRENVDRDNIDIVGVSIEESGGEITVKLEVKGTIKSDESSGNNMWYSVSLEDGQDGEYSVTYMFDETILSWPDGSEYGALEFSGFGTSTLETTFSLEDVGNPDTLEIDGGSTYEYLESEGSGEYYMDEAEPGSSTSGSSSDSSSGSIPFDVAKWGMLCIALAVIVPIVIIVLIIIVLVKVLGGEDEGKQPPQQGYQQPPPGQQGQQQQQPPGQQGQQQTPPPPGDQSDQTPPPPGDESEKEW